METYLYKGGSLKSLTSLWSCVAKELATRCCVSATRDIKTVTSRTEHEGLSFLAITLADYGKLFQRWLDRGFVVPSEAKAFHKASGPRTGFPPFLGGFLGRVFVPSSGVLLDNPDIEAIYAVRQLTLMFSKIALPDGPFQGARQKQGDRRVVSASRERLAMSEFIQCENDVKAYDSLLDPSYMEDFKRMSYMLFSELFAKVDRSIYWGDCIPKHGPGAVADKLTSNGKYNLQSWTARLQPVFPAEEFLIPGFSFREELRSGLNIVEPGAELPVRVRTVPKTLKTPRIIAIEPTAMQYAQQAILRSFLDAWKEDGFLSSVIGFDDQEPNRELARAGSLSGDLATLDLSEASDRVSNQHVRAMMEDFSHLHAAVQATRSRKADVPGHGVIRLAKFASMGSALCFPMEALVFTTLIFLGIERELSAPLSRESLIKRFAGRVRVFGDDLIVPREYTLSVVDELSTFGYKVNIGKSYWTGRFRESCGREYFDGHDVSIVKVRSILPTRRTDASSVVSAADLRNQLYFAGLWQGARWMDDYLRKLLQGVFPNVAPTSELLGRNSVLGYEFQGLDRHTFSPITKGYIKRDTVRPDILDGKGALLKCLLRMGGHSRFGLPRPDAGPRLPVFDDANVDAEHLERTGRPEHVSIKLGWASPF